MRIHVSQGFGDYGVDWTFGEEGPVVVECDDDVVGVWDMRVRDEVGEGVGGEMATTKHVTKVRESIVVVHTWMGK